MARNKRCKETVRLFSSGTQLEVEKVLYDLLALYYLQK